MRKKQEPVVRGAGRVRFRGQSGPATYMIEGDPTRLRLGVARLRGSITAEPDLALQAFQAGDAVLVLESGGEVRLTVLGHSAGSQDVFVEVRF